jgi:hypothetical protein
MKTILWSVASLLAILLVASGFAFVRGSLELFPTEEQHDKARLVYGAVFIVGALLEFAVARKLSTPSKAESGRAASHPTVPTLSVAVDSGSFPLFYSPSRLSVVCCGGAMPSKSLEPTPVTKARFVSVGSGAAQLKRWAA